MKIVVRTLSILMAALVVVGILYALDQSGTLSLGSPTRPDGVEAMQRPEMPEGTTGEPGAMALRGMADLLKTIAIVSVIVMLFVLFKRVWLWGRGSLANRHSRNDDVTSAPG